jgi:hypothetical protein
MFTRGRCWLLAGLSLAAVAVVALGVALFLAFDKGTLEAACRRVPLGADEEAVARAVGRPPDGVIGKSGRTAEVTRRVACWEDGDTQLLVEFDEDGRAVKAATYHWEPTRWDRFRAWLGF